MKKPFLLMMSLGMMMPSLAQTRNDSVMGKEAVGLTEEEIQEAILRANNKDHDSGPGLIPKPIKAMPSVAPRR